MNGQAASVPARRNDLLMLANASELPLVLVAYAVFLTNLFKIPEKDTA